MATSSKKKSSSKKSTAKKKTASRKTAASKKSTASKSSSASSKSRSPAVKTVEKLSGSVKKLMLANLGLYGQVLDELQNQAARASQAINDARRDPSGVNDQLVKRGEELANQITDILKRSGAPATKQLEKQLAELRSAVAKLRR
jgi:hypothetical protein